MVQEFIAAMERAIISNGLITYSMVGAVDADGEIKDMVYDRGGAVSFTCEGGGTLEFDTAGAEIEDAGGDLWLINLKNGTRIGVVASAF